VRKAPAEVTKVIDEISVLKCILDALEPTISSAGSPQYCILKESVGSNGPFESCKAILEELQKQLEDLERVSSVHMKMMWSTVVEEKGPEWLKELDRAKSTFFRLSPGIRR
jgi:hypothetical protein